MFVWIYICVLTCFRPEVFTWIIIYEIDCSTCNFKCSKYEVAHRLFKKLDLKNHDEEAIKYYNECMEKNFLRIRETLYEKVKENVKEFERDFKTDTTVMRMITVISITLFIFSATFLLFMLINTDQQCNQFH